MIQARPNILLILLCLPLVLANTDLCTDKDEEYLLTFHPHLDAFWLNTDTQLKDINFIPAGFLYQMNQRNSKTVFNSMLTALAEGNMNNPRKYFVTEIVFFKDWYDYLSPEKKEQVKQIIAAGKLEIANGGWVENDEAVCYYDDILDQYTLGMNFMNNQFKTQVKIGWATDSFGHSHSQAALQHLLGIEFQGIERVDDRYVNMHLDKPLQEFYWTPVSDSNNMSYGGVLNHIRHFLHQPNDLRNINPQTIETDIEKTKVAMEKAFGKKKYFRFLGNDFEEFISSEFNMLEKAMFSLNEKTRQSCPVYKYGNPTDYLQIITSYYDKNNLPVRKFDFMPNWDQDRYWSGFFTTDPQLKKTCKDFSRLVNFYRKSLLASGKIDSFFRSTLTTAEQLLAVMQHHDGITATSKTYIEDLFRNRMANKSAEILNNIKEIHGGASSVTCNIFENNQCVISGNDVKFLSIVSHGGSRKQKIEVKLPKNVYFDLEEVDEDIFCTDKDCTLLFEPQLHPGVNQYRITHKKKEEIGTRLFNLNMIDNMKHEGPDFVISIPEKNVMKYEFGKQFMTFGLYTSLSPGFQRQTMSWDKYGNRKNSGQYINAGMYIIANNGKIQPINAPFTELKVAVGRIYKRFIAKSVSSELIITIKNDEPNIVDVTHKFKPTTRNMADFFIKVSSTVRSSDLYHDSNGFLVMKRLLNWRPDYEVTIKPEDVINANIYPACSFAYLIQDSKKFLFFSDRAQGVASFEGDLLINFDRMSSDDGKGAGEGYFKMVENTFNYKFAVISARDDTERIWQRSYDEALIGFYNSNNQKIKYRPGNQISNAHGLGPATNIKYSIFWLSENEYVIRFQNLREFQSSTLQKYSGSQGNYQWNVEELGLQIKFTDIKDSYANGIPRETGKDKPWRKYWSKKSPSEINLQGQLPTEGQFVLKPLEIRSFLINTKSEIMVENVSDNKTSLGQIKDAKNLKTQFRKRCF